MASMETMIAALSHPAGLVMGAAAKGALLMAAAALVVWLLRSRAAAIRHAVWSAAIVGQLALLLLIPALPRFDVAMPIPTVSWSSSAIAGDEIAAPPAVVKSQAGRSAPAAPVESQAGRSAPAAPVEPQAGRSAPAARVESQSAAAPNVSAPAVAGAAGIIESGNVESGVASSPLTFAHLIALLWVLGTAVIFARFALATAAVARVARRSRPVEEGAWLALTQRIAQRLGIRRPLTLLRGAELEVPVTWGVVYPVVLLPEDAEEWPEERRSFVLLHELAHVRRFDALTQLLAQLATAIFWFNPLVWYASYRIRVEREHACDDYVLEHGTRASIYADGLLEIVRRLGSRREAAAPAFATLAMARRGELEGRMVAILDPRVPRRASARLVAGVAAALLVLALPLAAVRPVEASQPADSPAVAGSANESGLVIDQEAGTFTEGAGVAPIVEELPVDSGFATAAMDDAAPGEAAPQSERSPEPPMVIVDTPRVSRINALFGGRAKYRCTAEKLATVGETVLRHDSDHTFTELFVNTPGFCSHFVFDGDVRFTEALDDIGSMAPHARAYFHEMTKDGERLLSFEADARGVVSRSYAVNGRAAPATEARSWLGYAIRQSVLRHGYGLADRVAQLIQRRGIDAVLAEAGAAQSNSAKRVYYSAILDHRPAIDRREVDRVLRHAASSISSDSDLRVVASKAIERGASADAVQTVVARMNSDSDRRVVLSRALNASSDDAGLVTVLRSAREIGSSSDKASLLRQAAARAMRTQVTRREFLGTAATLHSSSDMRSALAEAARHIPRESAAVRDLLAAAPRVTSNSDRASLLRQVANAGLLVDEPARQAYNTAAETLTSDSDYRSVMRALR